MEEAISLFSLLNLAVKYTRFLFSTKVLNCSLPLCELIDPPLPHSTSLISGTSIRLPSDDGLEADAFAAAALLSLLLEVVSMVAIL